MVYGRLRKKRRKKKNPVILLNLDLAIILRRFKYTDLVNIILKINYVDASILLYIVTFL